jgi:hypothetical protein
VKPVERALMAKELSKAQAALWAASTIALQTSQFDVAKMLRDQVKTIGAQIVELNGGPVISLKELFR